MWDITKVKIQVDTNVLDSTRFPGMATESFSAGSQHRRSHPWQGHAERPDGQGESGVEGSSVWASTVKPKSVCLLSAIPYSSDITTFSLEKVNSGLQLTVSCIWKVCFSSNPFDGSLSCLTVGDFYNLLIVYSPLTARGTKLKAS